MIARLFSAFVLVLVITNGASLAQADGHIEKSTTLVRDLANEAVENITDTSITPEQRTENFRALFRKGFAVSSIARFVTGRYWRTASKEEREEYLVLFEDVIVNEWADRLFSQYNGQRLEVLGANDETDPDSPESVAIVKTDLVTSPTNSITIEWRVASLGDVIKITDIKVNGLSLATTQRDDFVSHASNNGRRLSAIIDKLRNKRDL
ncbi:MAG: MlaC/ttg2D family ABC transporter substrate-binding protein [Alphaproteobacteria bacterium]